jgi:hypothetical protein
VSTDDLPYHLFDPAIVSLCRVLNEFPGLCTIDSCQGFIDDHKKDTPWLICFRPDPQITFQGYCSIEFLAWALTPRATPPGVKVSFGLNAYAPHFNTPGMSAYFWIEGRKGHPDELAEYIRELRSVYFRVPTQANEG